MPRLSIRKLFLYVLAVASCLLLALNIQQRTVGLFSSHIPGGRSRVFAKHGDERANRPSGPSGIGGLTGLAAGRSKSEGNQRELHTFVPSDIPLDSSDKTIPAPEQRPWYMRDGKIRPTFKEDEQNGDQTIRDNKIFPEEYPNHDRIPEQLMHLPPKEYIPENQENADVPLKKILLWNGIQSWGGLRAGRGVFLKGKYIKIYTSILSTSLIYKYT